MSSGDPSLLPRLSDEILVLKDFTTVLLMPREERQENLAQGRVYACASSIVTLVRFRNRLRTVSATREVRSSP